MLGCTYAELTFVMRKKPERCVIKMCPDVMADVSFCSRLTVPPAAHWLVV